MHRLPALDDASFNKHIQPADEFQFIHFAFRLYARSKSEREQLLTVLHTSFIAGYVRQLTLGQEVRVVMVYRKNSRPEVSFSCWA